MAASPLGYYLKGFAPALLAVSRRKSLTSPESPYEILLFKVTKSRQVTGERLCFIALLILYTVGLSSMMAIPNTGRLVGQFYSKSCLMHTVFRPWVSRPVANPGQAKSKSNHVLKVFFSFPKRLFSPWSCNHELLRGTFAGVLKSYIRSGVCRCV
jgi:hypothetical protein